MTFHSRSVSRTSRPSILKIRSRISRPCLIWRILGLPVASPRLTEAHRRHKLVRASRTDASLVVAFGFGRGISVRSPLSCQSAGAVGRMAQWGLLATPVDVATARLSTVCTLGPCDIPVGHVRPGKAGRLPPRLSMARAMSASGDAKPKAMRVMSRIIVLMDSIRPPASPCSMEAGIASRCGSRWIAGA